MERVKQMEQVKFSRHICFSAYKICINQGEVKRTKIDVFQKIDLFETLETRVSIV